MNMQTTTLGAGVAQSGSLTSVFDFNGLAGLQRDAGKNPQGVVEQKQVARQFEAVFLQMMLKRMREATPKDGLFDSDQTRMLQAMGDEQLALKLADPGIGLAEALLKVMRLERGAVGLADEDSTAAQDTASSGSRPDRELSALLQVLRENRARDKVAAQAEGVPSHVVAFVSRMADAAHEAERQSGVPARLILGQAALESGWGRREILRPDGRTSHNLFGIKAGASWKGDVVDVTTTEYVDGIARKLIQPFRAYDSYEAAFTDYARLIGDSPRYAQVVAAPTEAEAARRIQQAGYATDPRYADKLIQVMARIQAWTGALDRPRQP